MPPSELADIDTHLQAKLEGYIAAVVEWPSPEGYGVDIDVDLLTRPNIRRIIHSVAFVR